MKIALYQGKSIISKLIKWKTRGVYSHASIIFSDGKVLEAWQGSNSVRYINNISDGHSEGTPVDIFKIDCDVDEESARKYADSLIGKKYGFWTIVQFLIGTSGDDKNKWICSELALDVVRKGGVGLLARVDAYKVSPVCLSWSPLLKLARSTMTIRG